MATSVCYAHGEQSGVRAPWERRVKPFYGREASNDSCPTGRPPWMAARRVRQLKGLTCDSADLHREHRNRSAVHALDWKRYRVVPCLRSEDIEER
jgi:hypothetical protein